MNQDNKEKNDCTVQKAASALSQRANKVLCLFSSGREWLRDSNREKQCDYRAVKQVSVSLNHTHTYTRTGPVNRQLKNEAHLETTGDSIRWSIQCSVATAKAVHARSFTHTYACTQTHMQTHTRPRSLRVPTL